MTLSTKNTLSLSSRYVTFEMFSTVLFVFTCPAVSLVSADVALISLSEDGVLACAKGFMFG